jgi:hypothetical protein
MKASLWHEQYVALLMDLGISLVAAESFYVARYCLETDICDECREVFRIQNPADRAQQDYRYYLASFIE